jgi:hypothetical protein
MYHIKLSFVNRELETLQLYDIFKENYSGTKLFQENNKIDTLRYQKFVVATQSFGAGKTTFGDHFLEEINKEKFYKNIKEEELEFYNLIKNSKKYFISCKNALTYNPMNYLLNYFNINTEDFKKYMESKNKQLNEYYFLGLYLKETIKGPIYIIFDDLDHFLEENSSIAIQTQAYIIWRNIQYISFAHEIFIYCTTRHYIFQMIGKQQLMKESPSEYFNLIFSPFQSTNLRTSISQTPVIQEYIKSMEKELYDYFLESIIFLTGGVPILIYHVLVEFKKYEIEFIKSKIDYFLYVDMFKIFSNKILSNWGNQIIYENLIRKENSKLFKNILTLAYFKIPVKNDFNIMKEGSKIYFGDLNLICDKLDPSQFFSIMGMYFTFEKDIFVGFIPPYLIQYYNQKFSEFDRLEYLIEHNSLTNTFKYDQGDLLESLTKIGILTLMNSNIGNSFQSTFNFFKDSIIKNDTIEKIYESRSDLPKIIFKLNNFYKNIKSIFPNCDISKVRLFGHFDISKFKIFFQKNLINTILCYNISKKGIVEMDINYFDKYIYTEFEFDIFPLLKYELNEEYLKILHNIEYLNVDLSNCDITEKIKIIDVPQMHFSLFKYFYDEIENNSFSKFKLNSSSSDKLIKFNKYFNSRQKCSK